MALGSCLALFTFTRVRLYFSTSGDGPALRGQISGTRQPLFIYLLPPMGDSVFSTLYVLLFGLDSPTIKPFPK